MRPESGSVVRRQAAVGHNLLTQGGEPLTEIVPTIMLEVFGTHRQALSQRPTLLALNQIV